MGRNRPKTGNKVLNMKQERLKDEEDLFKEITPFFYSESLGGTWIIADLWNEFFDDFDAAFKIITDERDRD